MFKYGIIGLLLASILGTVGVAQDSQLPTDQAHNLGSDERVLIADPEPVETEYFLAQGAAASEIVDDEEAVADAAALAALSDDMDGDMAAMPEVIEE